MKLKTSFFNGSVLKKDITRFLPVWGLYSVFLAVTVILMSNSNDPVDTASAMGSIIASSAVLNGIYALICVGTLWGDLYVSKMCNALHAMPMRREGWFLTHYVAGFLFSLVPNLLAALLSYPMLKEYYYLAFVWLGASTLQFLFFYGLALVSAFCTGSRLGLTAVYGILNFLAMFLYGLVNILYLPLLKGVVMTGEGFELFSPMVQMCMGSYIHYILDYGTNRTLILTGYTTENWIYLYVLAGIGILLALLGLLLYKKRHLERAGDFLVFRGLTGPFLVIVSLGAGLVFYLLSQIFFDFGGSYSFLLAGMALGFFIGKMLLDRTVRVLNLRSVLGFVLLIAITVGSFFVTKQDPFHLVRKIPEADQIESCSMRAANYNRNPYLAKSDSEIGEILEIHRQALDAVPVEGSDAYQLKITYHLKNGQTLVREYTLYADSMVSQQVEAIQSRWQIVFQDTPYTDFDALAADAYEFSIDYWDTSGDTSELWGVPVPDSYQAPLMAAIKADADEGNLAQGYMFHDTDVARVCFMVPMENAPEHWEIRGISCAVDISTDAVHTTELLQKMIAETDPESFG